MAKEYPSESRLFHGIQYWVSANPPLCEFTVFIGHGQEAIEKTIPNPELRSDDFEELFRRGHEYAQKLILQLGADQLAQQFGSPD